MALAIFRTYYRLFMERLFPTTFLFCGFVAQAQFSDSITHYARFSAAGDINRSNSNTAFLLNNDARFSIKNKHTTVNTAAAWLYGEQGSTLTNNDFNASADFNLYRDSSALYYWALAAYIASYSLQIRNQAQGGVGAAYNFVNTGKAWLNLSEGIFYEASHLNTIDPSNNQYQTFRNSLRLSYKFIIRNAVTVNGNNYWQPALGKQNDYSLRADNSLAVKLNKWISFAATISYNQFKRTGTENLLFTYGIVGECFF